MRVGTQISSSACAGGGRGRTKRHARV